jgi:hypothetical protein
LSGSSASSSAVPFALDLRSRFPRRIMLQSDLRGPLQVGCGASGSTTLPPSTSHFTNAEAKKARSRTSFRQTVASIRDVPRALLRTPLLLDYSGQRQGGTPVLLVGPLKAESGLRI